MEMNPGSKLLDTHIVLLSQKLTNRRILIDLGCRGLKLGYHDIDAAISNNQNDIQSAAYRVLQIWLRKQRNGTEAYRNLRAALQECEMQMLVDQLVQWGEASSGSPGMSEERMYIDIRVERLFIENMTPEVFLTVLKTFKWFVYSFTKLIAGDNE